VAQVVDARIHAAVFAMVERAADLLAGNRA